MWKNVKLTFKNIVICGGGCTKNKLLINFDVEKKNLKKHTSATETRDVFWN